MPAAVYLYCIIKSPRKPSVARAPDGIPGASRPEALEVTSSLWLIAAEAPLEQYGAEPLGASLQDLDWVGRIALAHEMVVEHFASRRAVTVIPMKLFTMFETRARALRDIAGRKDGIRHAMRRLEGAEEWGVRVMAAARGVVVPHSPRNAAASGASFLKARKAARDSVKEARAAAANAADRAFTHLAAIARDARRRDEVPSGVPSPPLLDAAFLVPLDRRRKFTSAARAEAAACARAGAHMTLSGPWPAYNFVALKGSSR